MTIIFRIKWQKTVQVTTICRVFSSQSYPATAGRQISESARLVELCVCVCVYEEEEQRGKNVLSEL